MMRTRHYLLWVASLFAISVGCGDGGEDEEHDAATQGSDASVGRAWDTIAKDQILFVANVTNPGSSGPETYLLSKDGTITMVLDDSTNTYNPSLSPSGEEIAFHRWMDDDFSSIELFTRNIGTGQETRITENDWADVAAKWSPDGTQLVFAAWSDAGAPSETSNLFIIDSLGQVVQLTSEAGRDDMDPAWCGPNRIVFKAAEVPAGDSKEEIWSIDVDGTNLRKLSVQSGWESDHDPRCTPDGERVYFYRYAADRPWKDMADLAVLVSNWDDFYPVNLWSNSVAGQPSEQVQLTHCEHSCPYPIPAPGGKVGYLHQDFILNGSNALIGSSTCFMVMEIDGTEPTKLLADSEIAAYLSTLQYWDW